MIRRVMITVAAALVCTFLTLGGVVTLESVETSSTSVVAYTYDVPALDQPTACPSPERARPAASSVTLTASGAVGGSHGVSVRSGPGTSPTAYTYNDPVPLMQIARGAAAAQVPDRHDDRPRSAVARTDVAAEGRTFSNLAPDDVIRPNGFQAIDPSSSSGVSGRFNYVVEADGRLVIANRRYGHIDLANGRDVLAAGEIRVVNGEIRSINNASGHYKPSGPEAQTAAEEAFGSSGLIVRSGAYSEIEP